MTLFWSTLRTGNGTAALWEALIEASETTLIVTPVLPVRATTGVLLVPEHVTVVLLGGAVLLHCAAADDEKIARRHAGMTAVAPCDCAHCRVLSFEESDHRSDSAEAIDLSTCPRQPDVPLYSLVAGTARANRLIHRPEQLKEFREYGSDNKLA
jgi:hypothetical protein